MINVLIILLLIVANGVFAMSEIAVVSARKARLQQLADKGDQRAQRALELAEHPNRFLSTVQIGITLVGIFAGAFGGATLAEPLAAALGRVSWLAPYSQALSLVLVVAAITYLSLVVGELVPKRLGLNNPERIATMVAGPMNGLSVIATPLVRLLSASTDGVLRLLRVRPSDEPPVSEEEITVLVEQGRQAGVIEEAEQEIVENVFWLGERRVSTLMTPRPEVVWFDREDPTSLITERLQANRYSRFLVCQGDLDHVVGVVHTRDLLLGCLGAGGDLLLQEALEPPLFVPETLRAYTLMERFRETGIHFAVVIDEYGGVEGIVTLNDLLEALLGELPDKGEASEPLIVRRKDGSWLLDGMLGIDELKEVLEVGELPHEQDGNYRTLGGFVTSFLGRIPQVSESFDWAAYRFEVMDMDGNRVDRVLVSPPDEAPESLEDA